MPSRLPSFIRLPLISGQSPLDDQGLLRDNKSGSNNGVPPPKELTRGVMSLPDPIDASTRILFCGRMTRESHIQMQQVLRYVYIRNDEKEKRSGANDAVTVDANGQKFTIARRAPPIVPDRDHARIVTPPYNVRILSVEDAAAITQFNDLLDAGATMNVKDFEFWMKSACNSLLEIMNNIYDVLSQKVISDEAEASKSFEEEVTSKSLSDHESAARRVLFALHELLGPAKLTINTFPFSKLLTEEAMRAAIKSGWTDTIREGTPLLAEAGGPSTSYGFAPNSKGLMGSAATGYGLDASHIRKLGCWDTIKHYIPTDDDKRDATTASYHRNAVFESGDQRFSQEGGGTRYKMVYKNELGQFEVIEQISPSQALATFVATNVRRFCVDLLKNTLKRSLEAKDAVLYQGGIADVWRQTEMSVADANKVVQDTLDALQIPGDEVILSYFFPVEAESGNPNPPKDDIWLMDESAEGGVPLRSSGNERGVNWKDQGVLSDKDILHLFGLPRPHRRRDDGKLVAYSADEEERKALADERLPHLTVTVAGGKHEPLQRVLQFISKLFVAPHAIDGATSDLSNVVAVITNYTMPLTYAETMDRSLAWKAAADPTRDLKKQYDGMFEILKVANTVFTGGSSAPQQTQSRPLRQAFTDQLRSKNLLTAFEELWAPTVVMQDGEQDDALAVKFSALILYLKDPLSLAKNFHVTFQLPSNTAIARKTEESDRGKAQDWLLTRTRLMWAMRAGVMNPVIRGRDTPLVRCFLDDQAENMDKIHQNSMWLASKKAGVF
jgi:hypothetical protein